MSDEIDHGRPILDKYDEIATALSYLGRYSRDKSHLWDLMVQYFTVDLDKLAVVLAD